MRLANMTPSCSAAIHQATPNVTAYLSSSISPNTFTPKRCPRPRPFHLKRHSCMSLTCPFRLSSLGSSCPQLAPIRSSTSSTISSSTSAPTHVSNARSSRPITPRRGEKTENKIFSAARFSSARSRTGREDSSLATWQHQGSRRWQEMESSPRAAAAGTEAVALPRVVSAVIVGAGRVGSALEKMGGGDDVMIRRGDVVPPGSEEGPIFVCTRNVDLDGVVEATPPSRRKDLVFFQNGMIEDWLASKGLDKNTQVLVYFAVAKMGDPPLDGTTDVNPEGLTAATGKWATAVATRLHAAGLSCKVLDPESFKAPMLEKLIWICVFMLVGARHPGATVGEVESAHRSEVSSLIKELATAASIAKDATFDEGLEERLCAYARAVAHYPTAVKEFEWRNGWFYSLSKVALEAGKPDPCPLHTAWLKEVGAI